MPDWLLTYLGSLQSGVMHTLASELRSGGIATLTFAYALGALHALTPGHGKAALAAFFFGREARPWHGLRIALSAAMLHVLSGFAAFLILRFVIAQPPSMTGRASPAFTAAGYAFIAVAGVLMLVQSLRVGHTHAHDGKALTAGIGLLPCPLTISVLGFAWIQSNAAMVGVVLISLALGIATTIGLVALAAILVRERLGAAMLDRLPRLERIGRTIQGIAGAVIVALSVYALITLR